MSVSSTISSVSYAGNASTTAAYPVTFQFFDSTDLVVYVVDSAGVSTTFVLGTGYTVSGGAGSTGNILTTSAIPGTSQVVITRNTAKTQLTSYTTGDRFPAATHEKALDKLTFIAQENARKSMPDTALTAGAAPYVLGLSAAGGTPTWTSQSAASIADGSITPAKLSAGKPTWDTSGNLTATGSVTASSFVGNVTGNVTGNLTGNVTGNVTGNLTGTASAIPDLIVSTAKIQDGAVTSAKIADGAIATADLANNSVTAAKLGTEENRRIAKAWVNFNGTTPITTAAGTYLRSGTTVTVTTPTAHGMSTGFNVLVTAATDSGLVTLFPNFVTITVSSTTQFTFTTASTGATSGSISVTTQSIRSSYNVSSVTKDGTGDYTINFATPMGDANYAATASSGLGNGNLIATSFNLGTAARVPTACRMQVCFVNGTVIDADYVAVQIFGN